ncbi:MAG TPA: protein kinase [Steroidobacteraceae bacterium]|nr:protein kinase [Steroidobacteraceae bacterium]
MSRPLRLLVVADDAQVGRWLLHRIESLAGNHQAELDDASAFERRLATTSAAGIDVLVPVLDFSPDTQAASFDWMDRVLDIPDMPPLVVVSQNGDELSAVAAMRRGAADYLPRRALDAGLLESAIAAARAARRRREHSERVRAAPQVALPAPLKVSRDLIPRYTLLDTLGESIRATVYLAHSAALNRNVALKVSHGSDDDTPQFAREFETVGVLRHPAVVDIFDYGVHEGREFIAMEYFPCGDLKARLQNPVSEREALDYLERIAEGLAAVHAQGILHRDLKPPNIMLREDGQVVLIDFGLARNLGSGTHSTRAGVLRGSPYYMSPEQAQGHELDPRSDLYSLGVLFFEMLTGDKPYLGNSAIEVLQQHVNGAMPQLPEGLAQHQTLLEGMMAKDRDDRFPSATDLLASLRQAAAA